MQVSASVLPSLPLLSFAPTRKLSVNSPQDLHYATAVGTAHPPPVHPQQQHPNSSLPFPSPFLPHPCSTGTAAFTLPRLVPFLPSFHAQPRRMSPARSTDVNHRLRHSRNPSRARPASQHPSSYSAAPAHPSPSMSFPLNASINGSRTPDSGPSARIGPQDGREVTTDVPSSSCSTTDSIHDKTGSTTSTVSRCAPRRALPYTGSKHGQGSASSHLSPASTPSSTAMVLAAHSDAATIHLYNVPPQGTSALPAQFDSKERKRDLTCD